MSLVSILIPCYGHHGTLKRALLSLCLQDCPDWEALVVDDGSQPPIGSLELPPDPRIKLLRLSHNCGRGAASQLALNHSRGDFIAFLDADDWYLPGKLSSQISFLEAHPLVDCVAGRLGCIDKPKDRLRVLHSPPCGWRQHGDGLDLSIPFAACMVRGGRARQIGFDSYFRRGQDRDFLHRLLHGHTYAIVPEVQYIYSIHTSFAVRAVCEGLRYRRGFYRKTAWRQPLWSLRRLLRTQLQLTLYPLLDLVGLWQRHVERHMRLATFELELLHQETLRKLEALESTPGGLT